ncbi:MAG: hypothetical protein ACE5KE_11070, partial [Methanosarcinales archaeon]
KENRLSRLSDLDLLEFSKKINMELIEYLETLFKEINIIPVQSNIFPELIKKYPFVEEDTITDIVKAFENALKTEIMSAKKDNPNKKIRIVFTQ